MKPTEQGPEAWEASESLWGQTSQISSSSFTRASSSPSREVRTHSGVRSCYTRNLEVPLPILTSSGTKMVHIKNLQQCLQTQTQSLTGEVLVAFRAMVAVRRQAASKLSTSVSKTAELSIETKSSSRIHLLRMEVGVAGREARSQRANSTRPTTIPLRGDTSSTMISTRRRPKQPQPSLINQSTRMLDTYQTVPITVITRPANIQLSTLLTTQLNQIISPNHSHLQVSVITPLTEVGQQQQLIPIMEDDPKP